MTIIVNSKEYNTIHVWNLRHWHKQGRCENCKQKRKTQWSNRSGEYHRDKTDWQELCVPCHKKYDFNKFGVPMGLGKRGKDKASRAEYVRSGVRAKEKLKTCPLCGKRFKRVNAHIEAHHQQRKHKKILDN